MLWISTLIKGNWVLVCCCFLKYYYSTVFPIKSDWNITLHVNVIFWRPVSLYFVLIYVFILTLLTNASTYTSTTVITTQYTEYTVVSSKSLFCICFIDLCLQFMSFCLPFSLYFLNSLSIYYLEIYWRYWCIVFLKIFKYIHIQYMWILLL